MEQLLNLVWLVAAVGVIFLVAACPHRRRDRFSVFVATIVLLWIALLLFPVISASDDLHAACDLSDDAAWRHDKRTLSAQFLALLVLISIAPLLVFHSILKRVTHELCATSPSHARLDFGRAPPLAS